jgi:hypothetical protein
MSPHAADTVEWKRPESIIAVLDRLGRELPGGHLAFLPGGGLIEITGASKGPERRSIQLEVGGRYVCVCRPVSLICVAFAHAPRCAYFDLELDELRRKDKAIGLHDDAEEWHGRIRTVDRSKPGNRTGENVWERGADYTRLLCGRIVIFSKGSDYAIDEQVREGLHDLTSREQLRKYIQDHVDVLYGPDRGEVYV